MASYSIYDCGSAIKDTINTMGTAPDDISIVPKEYGDFQAPAAHNFWINIEQVSERRTAETNNSFLQYFTLNIWVWVATPEKLPSVSSTIATKVKQIQDVLLYSTLGGWARLGISEENLGPIKYVKGKTSTNMRYGANFSVTVSKQAVK